MAEEVSLRPQGQQRAFVQSDADVFRRCTAKFLSLVPREGEEFKIELNILLDELNSLDYQTPKFVDEKLAVGLVCKACELVPLNYELLVTKVCHLLRHLVGFSGQKVVIQGRSLETCVEYVMRAVSVCRPWTLPDILRTLAQLLYQRGPAVAMYLDQLIGPEGLLMQFVQPEYPDLDIKKVAIACVYNLCLQSPEGQTIPDEYLRKVYTILMAVLQTPKPEQVDDILFAKLILCTLQGMRNLLSVTTDIQPGSLGSLLAVCRVYMLYGLPGQTLQVPATLYPTPVSQYDPSPKRATTKDRDSDKEDTSAQSTPRGRRVKKKRQRKQQQTDQDTAKPDVRPMQNTPSWSPAGRAPPVSTPPRSPLKAHDRHRRERGDSTGGYSSSEGSDYRSSWRGLASSSESEYSDNEAGHLTRLRSILSRVREVALNCLHNTAQMTDKRLMFGYWSHLLPECSSVGAPQSPTLFTSILKDPAPKARGNALLVLSSLVDGSKQYLAAAEETAPKQTAFTPYSVTLGSTVKEIHRCLLLALAAESNVHTLFYLLKCFATLIPNVPYHRLQPGLITKVVRQIRPLLSHKEYDIQVASLTCFHSILSVQAPLQEVTQVMKTVSSTPQVQAKVSQPPSATSSQQLRTEPQQGTNPAKAGDHRETVHVQESVEKMNINSSVETTGQDSTTEGGASSESNKEEGNRERTQIMESESEGVAKVWLLDWCLRMVSLRHAQVMGSTLPIIPVRTEAIQVMTQMAKGYFPFIRPHLAELSQVFCGVLQEQNTALQLQGGKFVEEVGAVLVKEVESTAPESLTDREAADFWVPLLSGPLPSALQNLDHTLLRSCGCQCLANTGAQVFQLLSTDKHILCITLLLGLTNDEEWSVRGAAVHALGVYVLYPCLKEDISFLADVAQACTLGLEEKNLSCRWKAAWSLGNLSNTIVSNKEELGADFTDNFSDVLLQSLFNLALKGAADHDKVKSNAVRTLGNLVRFLRPDAFDKINFRQYVEQTAQVLTKCVKTGMAKVRWNACYAVGNMFNNPALPLGAAPWAPALFSALQEAIKDCKNFKVRINATLALTVPTLREHFGSKEQFSELWGCLADALVGTERVEDFSEFKYRDTLREQLCSSLVHLTGLAGREDLPGLHFHLQGKGELLHTYLTRYRESLGQSTTAETSKKVEELVRAQDHFRQLAGQHMTDKEATICHNLSTIFADTATSS
ncbi:HEAT repeat-containing protein 6-like [Branchiostoma floridae]|uniref:HEAT repeat-containing protein 6 n=1 Tax=Branchiostoma floridae TaxID=7739 RepID=A0A9J7LXU3_BRAFL|nr:HEAT repeat-containing protein 6-like [Branchiostoma floridae]